MTGPIRLGIVGAGAIARDYAASLEGAGFARIVAVADIDAEAAGALAARAGCVAFRDHEALARLGGCEAALVSTPPNAHAAVALDLMAQGIAVMVEKPLCLGLADAHALVAQAESGAAPMTMASKFRFVPEFRHAHEIMGSGALGEIVAIENCFAARVDMRGRWNADRRVSGGGVLIDNGTHSLDIFRALIGPLAEVLAVEGKRVQTPSVEDNATLFARGEGGVVARADLSWTIDRQRETWLEIHGSEGQVQLGWRFARMRRGGAEDWTEIGGGYDKRTALRAQLANFCAALRGASSMTVTPADALASVAGIQAAYRSLAERRWVALGDAGRAAAAE